MLLAGSKDCGCRLKSLQDGWKVIGWLALTNSKYFGCSCKSLIDGWEMTGWLEDMAGRLLGGWPYLFPRISGVMLDGWEMAGGTPIVFEHPTQTTTISITKNRTVHIKTRTRWLGGWL